MVHGVKDFLITLSVTNHLLWWSVQFLYFKLVCFFSYYWDLKILYNSGNKYFIRYVFCKYFVPICDLAFLSLNLAFWRAWFNFQVHCIKFLIHCVYGVLFKKNLPIWGSQISSSMFSSRRFIVLSVPFSSMIRIRLIFVFGIKSRYRAVFFLWSPIIPTLFLEKFIFLH